MGLCVCGGCGDTPLGVDLTCRATQLVTMGEWQGGVGGGGLGVGGGWRG